LHCASTPLTLCNAQLEGWKRRRYWTWSVRDDAGGLLARLSSASSADGEAWVSALRAAGARVAQRAPDGLFGREPPPPPLAAMVSSSARPEFGDDAAASSTGGPPRAPQPASPALKAADAKPKKPFAGLRGSTPVHKEPQYSPLSSERLLYSSHAGLVNLVMIILVVNHCRLILENLTRYGVRVRAGFWVTALGLRDTPRAVPMVVAFLALGLFPLAALGLERTAAYAVRRHPGTRSRAERWVGLAHIVLTSGVVALPCAVIHVTQSAPLPGFILLSCALVLWMKLVSYAHANADLRGQWVAAAAAKKTGASLAHATSSHDVCSPRLFGAQRMRTTTRKQQKKCALPFDGESSACMSDPRSPCKTVMRLRTRTTCRCPTWRSLWLCRRCATSRRTLAPCASARAGCCVVWLSWRCSARSWR
jgi:hypothetical protein